QEAQRQIQIDTRAANSTSSRVNMCATAGSSECKHVT
ncbi:hypothetical protein A2U01_0046299, partial [Trifolium medium]|nr:hypothetical protein [Trifolium medium]